MLMFMQEFSPFLSEKMDDRSERRPLFWFKKEPLFLMKTQERNMEESQGWIKIYREMIDWQWAKSPKHFALFIQLLMRANYRPTKWRTETINAGQLLTGRKQISEWTGINESKVYRILLDLKKSGEIEQRTNRQYSIITIVNWDKYQSSEQRVNNERTTSEQRVNTSKKAKNIKNNKKYIISPLSFLFSQDDEIQEWLKTGTVAAQKQLLKKYSHQDLAEEIQNAYIWQLEKRPRKAGSFLITWMNNKQTHTQSNSKSNVSAVTAEVTSIIRSYRYNLTTEQNLASASAEARKVFDRYSVTQLGNSDAFTLQGLVKEALKELA